MTYYAHKREVEKSMTLDMEADYGKCNCGIDYVPIAKTYTDLSRNINDGIVIGAQTLVQCPKCKRIEML